MVRLGFIVLFLAASAQFQACQNILSAINADKDGSNNSSTAGLTPDSRPDPWFGRTVISPPDGAAWIRVYGMPGAIDIDGLEQRLGHSLSHLTVTVYNESGPSNSGYILSVQYEVVLIGSNRGAFNLNEAPSVQGTSNDRITISSEVDGQTVFLQTYLAPKNLTFSTANIIVSLPTGELFTGSSRGAKYCRTDSNNKLWCFEWNSSQPTNRQLPADQVSIIAIDDADLFDTASRSFWVVIQDTEYFAHIEWQPTASTVTAYNIFDLGIEGAINTIASQRTSSGHSLWIGTSSGLFEFKVPENQVVSHLFNPPITNYIKTVFVDSHDNVWAGTEYGVMVRRNGAWSIPGSVPCEIYNIDETTNPVSVWIASACGLFENNDQFRLRNNDNARVKRLLRDKRNGSLWYATPQSLIHLNGDLSLIYPLGEKEFEDMVQASDGSIWLAAAANGLIQAQVIHRLESDGTWGANALPDCNYETPVRFLAAVSEAVIAKTDMGQLGFLANGTYNYVTEMGETGYTEEKEINKLLPTTKNGIAIAGANGLQHYSEAGFKTFRVRPNGGCQAIGFNDAIQANDESVYASSEYSSFHRIFLETNLLYRYAPRSLGAVYHGSELVPDSAPPVLSGYDPEAQITDFEKTSDGTVYFSSQSDQSSQFGHITRISNTQYFTYSCAAENVHQLLNSGDRMYMLSETGIDQLNLTTETCERIISTSQKALRIGYTADGSVWAVLNKSQLMRSKDGVNEIIALPKLMDGYAVEERAVFLEDSHGFIWVGTSQGLYLLGRDGSIKQEFACGFAPPSIPSCQFNDILEADFGEIWVATGDQGNTLGGLSIIAEMRRVYSFTNSSGLAGIKVTSLVKQKSADGATSIWVGTNQGISIFSPAILAK